MRTRRLVALGAHCLLAATPAMAAGYATEGREYEGFTYAVVGLFILMGFAGGTADIAKKKGYNPVVWGVVGFVLNFLGVLIAYALPNKRRHSRVAEHTADVGPEASKKEDVARVQKQREGDASDLYERALAIEVSGELGEALALYTRLVDEFPDSTRAADAASCIRALRRRMGKTSNS